MVAWFEWGIWVRVGLNWSEGWVKVGAGLKWAGLKLGLV